MAQITWGTIESLNVPNFNVSLIANIFPTAQDPDLIAGDYRLLGEPDVVTQFLGGGFTFANGFPIGGLVSSLVTTDGGQLVGRFDGLAIPAADLAQWIFSGDDATARAVLFAGDDTILASPFDDLVQGYGGNDVVYGGDGFDTLLLQGSAADYALVAWGGQVGAVATSGDLLASNGIDKGYAVEQLAFMDSSDLVAVTADNFAPLAYIASYGDLTSAFGVNAQAGFDHYVYNGINEGRTTGFDGLDYIASYGDLIEAFGTNELNGTLHYLANGFAEGRTTTFDGLQYIASYGDLIQAFGVDARSGALHFIANGFAEGRAADLFDAEQYLANYADLQAAFGSDTTAATMHFIANGFAEGRNDGPPGGSVAADFHF